MKLGKKKISISIYKRKNFIKKLENEVFESSYLYWICNSKAIEICPNQHADLLRIDFTEDSLKIKKGPELVSRPYFSQNFLIKNFIL